MDLGSVVSNGYSFQVEMTFRARQAGFRIAEVPIIFTERRSGCSKMSGGVICESLLLPLKLRLRALLPARAKKPVTLRLVQVADQTAAEQARPENISRRKAA